MSGVIRKKQAGEAWETVADAGGGAPSGPAGGVLDGTYPNPTIPSLTTILTPREWQWRDENGDVRVQLWFEEVPGHTELLVTGCGPGQFDALTVGDGSGLYMQNGTQDLEIFSNVRTFIANHAEQPLIDVDTANDMIGLFGTSPVAQPTITGALSAVVDPNVKAVLTSIIAALATAAGVGLVADGTT